MSYVLRTYGSGAPVSRATARTSPQSIHRRAGRTAISIVRDPTQDILPHPQGGVKRYCRRPGRTSRASTRLRSLRRENASALGAGRKLKSQSGQERAVHPCPTRTADPSKPLTQKVSLKIAPVGTWHDFLASYGPAPISKIPPSWPWAKEGLVMNISERFRSYAQLRRWIRHLSRCNEKHCGVCWYIRDALETCAIADHGLYSLR